jgi:hypothetical protein
MTDWRQIQARIRKAKNSPDAVTRLNELFQRTRDGMVAWELGAIEEKSDRAGEAVKWYTVAAERFRRAEWKKKAEEALVRLGAPVPARSIEPDGDRAPEAETPDEVQTDDGAESQISVIGNSERLEEPEDSQAVTMPHTIASTPRIPTPHVPAAERVPVPVSAPRNAAPEKDANGDNQKRKRRRGRRGGRGRRGKEGAATPSLPTQAFAESVESQAPPPAVMPTPKPDVRAPLPFRQPEAKTASPVSVVTPVSIDQRQTERPTAEPAPIPLPAPDPVPQMPSQRAGHGRAEPGLASRMAHLESMLRRLLSSQLRRLDDLEQAPAGPGVFLLSDSDQVTSYYVEACQTLRVGLGNVARGGRSAKNYRGGPGRGPSESGIKSKLAEHLGIDESKVAQYMKDHCVVRWIQLDDEAAHLAHFAIGVLKTPLNIE